MAGFGQVFLVKPWNLPGQAKFSLNTLMQTSEATQITARLATSLATPQVGRTCPTNHQAATCTNSIEDH